MATNIKLVHVPVPRPQRLTDVYDFHCPACDSTSERLTLDNVACPTCGKQWGLVVWRQKPIEDDRPAVCPNPDCPHAA